MNEEISVSEQAAIRRDKLQGYIEAGNNPYHLTRYVCTHRSMDIVENFDALEGQEVSIAGRMMSRRVMGKASFAHVQDEPGQLQVYVKRDVVGADEYQRFKELDIGDCIGVRGKVFRTQKGEVSVEAEEITLLAKSLLPLPEKFHGLKDPDIRYRQRYLDMIVNPEVKRTFLLRTKIIKAVREFFDARGYIEVDTPVLHTSETGATARPFVTHHNTLDIDMYLRIETELHLKRLIVGGLERVYEIGRIFRNEGMDIKHNPEFTTIEFYEAYADYRRMMERAQGLFQYVADTVLGRRVFDYQGVEMHLEDDFAEITMVDAVKEHSGLDFNDWADDEAARAALKAKGVEIDADATRGQCLERLFDEFVEDKLVQPTFVTEYPVEISPLAKRMPGKPGFTERFELFMNAREMGNAFSELNDPFDQRGRFEKQVAAQRAKGVQSAQVDDDFVTAIEYGMPPTGGMGIGIERMVMLFTNSYSIRDVLLFPTMKPR